MRFLKLALLFMAPFFMANTAIAAAQEGVNYKTIVPAQPTETGEKIEVIEIFSYGCSHCHRFEPALERWLKTKPDNVEFTHMPAIFNQQLAMYARAYYAAEALEVLDKVHKPFFEAIHLQKRRFDSEEAIADLFEENGVDRKKFSKAFRSFSVEAKVKRAAELGRRYGVEATPSMVVNGKYITNPGQGQQGFKGMLKTIDELIAAETKGS
ncbi:thiol:disulfide interchange protein DsbA/DsbL [Pseudomonadota bacterium]